MTTAIETPARSAFASTPAHAADTAAAHALLSCWLREVPGWTHDPATRQIAVPLTGWNARLLIDVERLSPTYRHRIRLPARLEIAGRAARSVGLPILAALLADELKTADGASPTLLARVLDSAAAVTAALDQRAADVDRLWSPDPLAFGEAEQALLLGHAVHPTPKSRGEMSADQRQRFSPETAGRFPLRWLAVEPGLVRQDSAVDPAIARARGAADASAAGLATALLRQDPGVDPAALDATLRALGPRPRILLPAHPFQADRLAADPSTADLFDSGAVVDLGQWGAPYLPTTSVRTVYRADAPWQLKFSLHVRVTNSMRVLLPKELDRAVESARLHRTEVGRRAASVAPRFVLLQDPAYLTLVRDGRTLDGFSALFRENRWTPGGPADVTALTTLCQDHPFGGRSRLVAIVDALAVRTGRGGDDIAREWFARFCDVVVCSLLRLYLDVGLCFEAHQQNTLVELDGGWPVRGVYRDSQGYFHREAAHDDLIAVQPRLGEATESIFAEALADERLVYYLFVNLTLGVINALGDRVDERLLLADLRHLLEGERARGGRYPATLLDRLLDAPAWPCKANLLTRALDLDELIGDISTQSAYVTVPNPLEGL